MVDVRPLAIDIIVPLYNEERTVAEFHRQLMDVVTRLSTVLVRLRGYVYPHSPAGRAGSTVRPLDGPATGTGLTPPATPDSIRCVHDCPVHAPFGNAG